MDELTVCELYFNKTVSAKLKTGKQNKRLKRFGGKTEKKKKRPSKKADMAKNSEK